MVTRPNVSTPKNWLNSSGWSINVSAVHPTGGKNTSYFRSPPPHVKHDILLHEISIPFFFLISTWDIYPSHAPREIDESGPSELLTRPIIVSFNREYHVHVNEKPKIIQEAGLHISCMVTSFVSFFQLLACCWDFSSWIFPTNSRG